MGAKFVIAGGSGFIGSAAGRRFRGQGGEVVILTRAEPSSRTDGGREVQWLRNGAWRQELEGADAVINLAGETIRCRFSPENLQRVLESRLVAVRELADAIASCGNPPKTWVQASACGFYGNRGRERCDENTPPGSGALADVCRAWEAAFAQACPANVRPVVLRIGMVLGRDDGAYPVLRNLTRAFLGGTAGDGEQGMSWILLDDLISLIDGAATNATMSGVYNATAPEPVKNSEFMKRLRAAEKRPWSPPAPAFAVKIGARLMGVDPSLILEGQFALPARLEAEGFRFSARTLDEALRRLATR